jgi:hypothetical protein
MTSPSAVSLEQGRMAQRKQRFARLISAVPHPFARDLFVDYAIEPVAFDQLRMATCTYISACLGACAHLTEAEILQRLSDPQSILPNKTPNGLLLPKVEVTVEFTLLHKALVQIIEKLGISALADGWSLPINVRVVLGSASSDVTSRPYAASKIHSDVWAGEPSDTVVMNIPVLGDIARTSLEWLELPADLGDSYLKLYRDYADAEPVARLARRIELEPQLGHIYFSDCALLHRTLRKGGACRVSIDLRFRFSGDAQAKQEAERLSGPSRLANYVSFAQWASLGRDTVLACAETMADAGRNYGPSKGGACGDDTRHRLVPLRLGR